MPSKKEGGFDSNKSGKQEIREKILQKPLDTFEFNTDVYMALKTLEKKTGTQDLFTIRDLAMCSREQLIDAVSEVIDNIVESGSRMAKLKKYRNDKERVSADIIQFLTNFLRSHGLDFNMTEEEVSAWLQE